MRSRPTLRRPRRRTTHASRWPTWTGCSTLGRIKIRSWTFGCSMMASPVCCGGWTTSGVGTPCSRTHACHVQTRSLSHDAEPAVHHGDGCTHPRRVHTSTRLCARKVHAVGTHARRVQPRRAHERRVIARRVHVRAHAECTHARCRTPCARTYARHVHARTHAPVCTHTRRAHARTPCARMHVMGTHAHYMRTRSPRQIARRGTRGLHGGPTRAPV